MTFRSHGFGWGFGSLVFVALLSFAACMTPHRAFADPVADSIQLKNAARAAALDTLFAQLAQAPDIGTARMTEAAIVDLWMQSGSPSIDLLMSRGLSALSEKKTDRAMFYFNEAVQLAPGFAEAWDRRAGVYYVRHNYSEALQDFKNVLRIEPRHFLALAAIGDILNKMGDRKGAALFFKQAQDINPWLFEKEKSKNAATSLKGEDGS